MSMMVSFVLSFFPRDVLDEILNLIESVSEDFPSYSLGLIALQKGLRKGSKMLFFLNKKKKKKRKKKTINLYCAYEDRETNNSCCEQTFVSF